MLLGGLAIVARRSFLASWTAKAQRNTFGKSAESVAKRQTPTRMLVTGIFIAGTGLLGIVMSFLGLDW